MSEIRSQATPAVSVRDRMTRIAQTLLVTRQYHSPSMAMLGLIDALADDGWSKPRTVNSATELDALPVGSVIRSEDVTALKARNGGWLWDDGNYWEPLAGREVSVLFTPGDAG